MHVAPARSLAAAAAAAGLLIPLLAMPGPAVAADDAPGAPGADATWRSGDKDGVGTSTTRASKVWYTLADGTLSETYYPAADTPNVRDLQFAVTDGTTAQRETDDSVVRTAELADPTSLTYRQVSTDKAGRWRLTKTYVTDPARSSLMISVDFEVLSGGPFKLFALYDPSLAGTSTADSGSTAGGALVATDTHLADRPIASALVASTGFTATSTGYVGTSDGWTDLSDGRLDTTYAAAGPGNVAQTGEVPVSGAKTSFTLALGFGADAAEATSTAKASLATGYAAAATAYQRGWSTYLASLKKAPKNLTGELLTQYNVSVMTVKAHEDKTYPGAFIASLTLPWGQVVNADGAGGGGAGYHFVWARDLYHQVTSLLAAGDTGAADRAVTWLFTRQQLPDGRFPQNSHVDGSPDQNNVQLDETAFPIVLAWQVGRTGGAFYRDHIKKAADFLVASGPRTPQERWETEDGYSPSTMASQIAGLTAAADIARKNGDDASAAVYQGTADDWQRSTEKWMYTTTGPVGDGKYYVRIEGDGDPNDGDSREYSDGAGVHEERSVLDAGFLELVRLGVKAPNDPYVAGSLPETDRSLATDTPSGRMWHRYTYDGYGEQADGSPWTLATGGIGRLWPLLSGERGEYELANGRDALSHLRTMHRSANAGYMIPEQAWDRPEPTSYGHEFGKGTGSAGPLAWAMAQYVRLARGIANGSPVETPKVTQKRYVTGPRLNPPALTVTSPSSGVQLADGDSIHLTGTTDGRAVYVGVNGVEPSCPALAWPFRCRARPPGHPEPGRRRRGGRTRRHQHGDPHRAGVRRPHRLAPRSDRRRQRAGHVRLPRRLRLQPRDLRPDRDRRVRPRRPGRRRDGHRRGDREPLRWGPDLPPADQRLPRLGLWRCRSGAAGDEPEHGHSVVPGRGHRRPLLQRWRLRLRAAPRSVTSSSWRSPRPARSSPWSTRPTSAPSTWRRRATASPCSATPRRARGSASSAPSTTTTTGTATPSASSATGASVAVQARSTSVCPARTPTPGTRTPSTSSSVTVRRRRR